MRTSHPRRRAAGCAGSISPRAAGAGGRGVAAACTPQVHDVKKKKQTHYTDLCSNTELPHLGVRGRVGAEARSQRGSDSAAVGLMVSGVDSSRVVRRLPWPAKLQPQ